MCNTARTENVEGFVEATIMTPKRPLAMSRGKTFVVVIGIKPDMLLPMMRGEWKMH
jgi:hypothetical protein